MQQELDAQQRALLWQPQTRVSPLCLGCRFEVLLQAKAIDLSDRDDWEMLANQWGEQPLVWLRRCINGEVAWIPHMPFVYLMELLDVTPGSRQETILTSLNKRSLFRRGAESQACARHSKP